MGETFCFNSKPLLFLYPCNIDIINKDKKNLLQFTHTFNLIKLFRIQFFKISIEIYVQKIYKNSLGETLGETIFFSFFRINSQYPN